MKRVILDSQSNRHFRGVALEQAYDQRGGICQAGAGDIVVTTDPILPDFLAYWESLGFDLPEFFVAGPFDPECTLSHLVLRNGALQEQIKSRLNGEPARLEFFCIEESERQVARALGIAPYCNFDIAIPLSRKPRFKRLFQEIGLRTPAWFVCRSREDIVRQGALLLASGRGFLIKADDGTGGIACGGMQRIEESDQLLVLDSVDGRFGDEFFIEEIIPRSTEVSLHWEMQTSGETRLIGVFEQLSRDFGYFGVVWPPRNVQKDVICRIMDDAEQKFWPALRALGALGFFCCDIILDATGAHYWVDFNPRKGAILYVRDMVQRLACIHENGAQPFFLHEHLRLPEREEPYSFSGIRALLADLLNPRHSGFAVISNPGVIAHGYCDVTGISWESADGAESLFRAARRRLCGG